MKNKGQRLYVILLASIDNKNVTKTSDISNYLINKKPGTNAKLTIFRDNKIKEINIPLDTVHAVSQESPWIAASGSKNVYAIWQENATGNYTVFFSKSTDGGASFSEPTLLTNSIKGDAEIPKVAASGSNVYVVWFDDIGNRNKNINDIYFKRSTNYGNTFGSTIDLSHNTGTSEHASISAFGNSVYVVWSDNSTHC